MASARRIQLAAISAIALAVLALAALALGARADALAISGELSRDHHPELLVSELTATLHAVESDVFASLLAAKPGRLEAVEQEHRRIGELISALARQVETPAEHDQLTGVRAAVSRQFGALARLRPLPSDGRGDPQLAAAAARQEQDFAALLARLDALATGYQLQADERRARLDSVLSRLALAIDALGGALVLLLGLIALRVRRAAQLSRQQGDALGAAQNLLASQVSGRERDQRAGEERRRLVFSRLQIGTWEYRLADQRLLSSREALEVLGGPGQSEVVGEAGLLALVHLQDRERVRLAFAAALAGAVAGAVEFRVDWRDGQQRWVATHATVMHDAEGRAERLVGIHQDITARKRAEAALRDSETRLSLAVEAARLGTWEWEYASARVALSPTARSLFGLAVDAAIDLDALDRAIDECDRQRVQEARAMAAHTGAGMVSEFRVRGSDDAQHWLCFWSLPRKDADGTASTGQVGMVQDITERRRGEEQIRARNLELETRVAARTDMLRLANQELEAFTYSVSHDLRAPLRAIDGFSAALLEDHAERLDQDGRDLLTRVRRAAQRMAELIDDLLGLSRVSLSQLQTAPCDLSAIAGEIAAALVQSHPARRFEILVQPGVQATGDARLLRIALENLLGNAVKFSARRDPARIEFGVRASAGIRTLFVADNGAGFDMAHAGKLFSPFQRLHQVGEFPGTGVGLAIVQRIIHRHGGMLRAEASIDGGATFSFTLP